MWMSNEGLTSGMKIVESFHHAGGVEPGGLVVEMTSVSVNWFEIDFTF